MNQQTSLSNAPLQELAAVTPNDTNAVPMGFFRAVYLTVGGTVSLTPIRGTAITITGLATGVWHPLAGTHIRATGTTATGILVGR